VIFFSKLIKLIHETLSYLLLPSIPPATTSAAGTVSDKRGPESMTWLS
jgi:hypothetical protein